MGVTPGPSHSYSPRGLSSEESSFLGSLFDFSFEQSITPMIVRGAFILYLIFDILIAILILSSGALPFLLRIILAFAFFFTSLIGVRLTLEGTMALHNIERYTRESARNSKQ